MGNENVKRLIFKEINPFSDIKFVEELWADLQEHSVHSYFNSWGWISTWLGNLPPNTNIRLHVAYLAQKPVAAFFLGNHKRKRYRFLSYNLLSLNATSISYYDILYTEYNTILYDKSLKLSVAEVLDYIKYYVWDEFNLSALSQKFVDDFSFLNEEQIKNHKILNLYSEDSYFVELQKIRDVDMNFLQLLSSNRRSQIRRSLKQYEQDGKIKLQEASSTEEALAMLDELAKLHQQEWTKRGKHGVFSNPFFYQFHKDLIRNRFSKGEIQILHIFTEQVEIGYLYFFVYQNNVLFYQSGFNYQDGNNYRPGLISHYLAILYNTKKNMTSYDFLAGDSSYKRTLSTELTPMYWFRMYKSAGLYNLAKVLLKKQSTPISYR